MLNLCRKIVELPLLTILSVNLSLFIE